VSELAFALPDEPLLSLEEIAERLSVSVRTVQRLVADDELRPFYVGTSPRFDPRDVADYLERTRSQPRRRPSQPRPRLIEGGGSDSFVDRLRSRE
jgi:excisionase family DNA binding protein